MDDKPDYENDQKLVASIWFTPQCIRDHYEDGEPWDDDQDGAWVATATDEQLAAVGLAAVDWFLSNDGVWGRFHDAIGDAIFTAKQKKGE